MGASCIARLAKSETLHGKVLYLAHISLHCTAFPTAKKLNSTQRESSTYTLIIPLHFLEVALGISIPFHQRRFSFFHSRVIFLFSFIHFGPFWWTDVDESCKYKRSEKHWKYRFSPSHRGLQHLLKRNFYVSGCVVCVLHSFPFKTCAILLSSHQSY